MSSPTDRRYLETHEWARQEGGEVICGITRFAVEALQDLVFIELPQVGARTEKGRPFGEIESVKAVSDLIAPVTGEVVAVNAKLGDDLDILKRDAYGDGWMIRIRADGDADALLAEMLDGARYDALTAEH